MSLDYQKNSAFTAEPRPMWKGGLRSGLCSIITDDLKSAYSGFNRSIDLDVSIDLPPPYEIASNTNVQADIPLLQSMQPQPAEGQTTTQPLQNTSLLALYCNLSLYYVTMFTLAILVAFIILGIYFRIWKFKAL
jgi:hypothetical protein